MEKIDQYEIEVDCKLLHKLSQQLNAFADKEGLTDIELLLFMSIIRKDMIDLLEVSEDSFTIKNTGLN